jgi:hypothetical protein
LVEAGQVCGSAWDVYPWDLKGTSLPRIVEVHVKLDQRFQLEDILPVCVTELKSWDKNGSRRCMTHAFQQALTIDRLLQVTNLPPDHRRPDWVPDELAPLEAIQLIHAIEGSASTIQRNLFRLLDETLMGRKAGNGRLQYSVGAVPQYPLHRFLLVVLGEVTYR